MGWWRYWVYKIWIWTAIVGMESRGFLNLWTTRSQVSTCSKLLIGSRAWWALGGGLPTKRSEIWDRLINKISVPISASKCLSKSYRGNCDFAMYSRNFLQEEWLHHSLFLLKYFSNRDPLWRKGLLWEWNSEIFVSGRGSDWGWGCCVLECGHF